MNSEVDSKLQVNVIKNSLDNNQIEEGDFVIDPKDLAVIERMEVVEQLKDCGETMQMVGALGDKQIDDFLLLQEEREIIKSRKSKTVKLVMGDESPTKFSKKHISAKLSKKLLDRSMKCSIDSNQNLSANQSELLSKRLASISLELQENYCPTLKTALTTLPYYMIILMACSSI